MYELYKSWCNEHGRLSNTEYVLKYVHWQSSGRLSGSALEPALAPYLLEEGIEHWILWHHPERGTPGDTNLDREDEIDLAMDLAAQAGARLVRHDVVCFQNVPELRSIPQIAHSHIFLRVGHMPEESRRVVAEMRALWRSRSPWLLGRDPWPEDSTPLD